MCCNVDEYCDNGVCTAIIAAGVPQTGQTTCYREESPDNWVACGSCLDENCEPHDQDGALQEGVAWPNPRFTDHTDGTVTDNLTGLMWLKDADCLGTSDWSGAFAQVVALNAGTITTCDDYTEGSYGDWRLPNTMELLSLIDWAYSNPALSNAAGTAQWTTDGDAFSGVVSNFYWSSTTSTFNTDQAFFVALNFGGAGFQNKANTYSVWPVRGGQ